jgi:hypothetical protein
VDSPSCSTDDAKLALSIPTASGRLYLGRVSFAKQSGYCDYEAMASALGPPVLAILTTRKQVWCCHQKQEGAMPPFLDHFEGGSPVAAQNNPPVVNLGPLLVSTPSASLRTSSA